MAKVKGKDTTPEKIVRRCLHKAGFRFRLHRKDLPGKPDIVLPKYKTVIFVHGCFWHGHEGCSRSRRPTTNVDFWIDKLDRNICRDQGYHAALREMGWKVIVVWECELKNAAVLSERLKGFLHGN